MRKIFRAVTLLLIASYPITGNPPDEADGGLEGPQQVCSGVEAVEKAKKSVEATWEGAPEGAREWLKGKALHEIESLLRKDPDCQRVCVVETTLKLGEIKRALRLARGAPRRRAAPTHR